MVGYERKVIFKMIFDILSTITTESNSFLSLASLTSTSIVTNDFKVAAEREQ